MTDSPNLPLTEPTAIAPAPEPPVPPELSVLHKIFIGPSGLRAGWSLLIFFAFMYLGVRSLNSLIKILHLAPPKGAPTGELSPAFGIGIELLPFLTTAFVTWLMSKIEKRPNSVYGLGSQRAIPHFFAGFAWGLLCLSLLIAILKGSGLLAFDHRLLFGRAVFGYGAIWLFGFLLVGLFEEYLTRGYILFTLTRGIGGLYHRLHPSPNSTAVGFWTSAILLSILFGLGHGSNPGESPIGLLSAGLAGLVFCLSLWRTGSLWWAIGFHTTWDWAQSFLYGVADSGAMVQGHLYATRPVGQPLLSGGATGPEGSILILPMFLLIVLIILFTLPRTSYPVAPQLEKS